jgi:hypothetical protein
MTYRCVVRQAVTGTPVGRQGFQGQHGPFLYLAGQISRQSAPIQRRSSQARRKAAFASLHVECSRDPNSNP